MTDRGEVVAPLYLLVKDHKGWRPEDGTPPPSRPVCSRNMGFNRHISEILSLILEPLGHAIGGEDTDSTGGLLSKIQSLNAKLAKKEQNIGVRKDPEERKVYMKNSESAPPDGICENKPTKSFGQVFKRFSNDVKIKRISNLRKLTDRNSVAPNIRARLWALRLLDQVSAPSAICLPGEENERRVS